MPRNNRKTLLTKRLLPAFKRWLNDEYDCNLRAVSEYGERLRFTVEGVTHVISDNRLKYGSLLISLETEPIVQKFLRMSLGFSRSNTIWMLFIGDEDDMVPCFCGWWGIKPEAKKLMEAIDSAVMGESGATIERVAALLRNTQGRFGRSIYYFRKVKEGDFVDI